MNSRVWQLAWPMILSNLTVPLLGLVDAAILGHLPQATYLGAAALGGMIFTMLFWAFGFLRMGTTGMAAQAFGRGDTQATGLVLYRSLCLALFLAVLLMLLQAPLFEAALAYMSPSAEVEIHTRIYCEIRIYAAPATLGNFVIYGWLLSVGKPKAVMWLAILANLVNLLLDYLLVVHAGMLTAGVAWGSLCADYVAFFIGLAVALPLAKEQGCLVSLAELVRIKAYGPLLRVNRYLFVRTVSLLFAFSFFYAQSAQQTDLVLAANSILITLLMLFSYGQDGFANAAEVLTGRAIGKGDMQEFFAASRSAAAWSAMITLVFIALAWVGSAQIIQTLTSLPGVAAQAQTYWPWLLLTAAVAGWSFLLDGIFIGATKGRAMQYSMLLAAFLVFLPAWYLLSPWGNHGLWAAFMLFNLARSLSLGLCYAYFSLKSLWCDGRATATLNTV